MTAPVDDPNWDFLDALRNAKPDDPDGAERLFRELIDARQDVQKAIVATILDSARRDREEREQDAQQGQPRAVAEQREHYQYGRTG